MVHAALDAGVTLIDTADAYARDGSEFGHNESLVASALRSYGRTDDVLVATKGGHTRGAGTGSSTGRRRTCARRARRRCGGCTSTRSGCTSSTDPTRPRPARSPWGPPLAVDAGLVRMLGISNADIAQIDVARSILGDALVSVQNQFSPGWRFSADELAHCRPTGAPGCRSPFGGVSAAGSWTRPAPAFAEVADELGVRSTGSRWPGTSRRPTSSCRSPGRPGRRRSSTPRPPPTSSLSPDQLARLERRLRPPSAVIIELLPHVAACAHVVFRQQLR